MNDIKLEDLPENLRPIKPAQWKEACEWIRLRWGRTAWEDDILLFNDAQFWCEDELWGGIQLCFDKGSEFPPNMAELSKKVMEWRQHNLQAKYDELNLNKELPAPKGSLRDYLDSIGAESFAHACYKATQERAKNNRLLKFEDPTSYDNWTMDWSEAKATYMTSLGKVFDEKRESSVGG